MARLGESFRFNGKHKACGARFSTFATYSWNPNRKAEKGKNCDFYLATDGQEFESGGFGIDYICACGRHCTAKPVRGKYRADRKCDSRCTQASGHDCECSCGGKNHGSGD